MIGCGLLAAGAQQVLDNAVDQTEGWVIWDLLPAGVWLVTLAVAVDVLPGLFGVLISIFEDQVLRRDELVDFGLVIDG